MHSRTKKLLICLKRGKFCNKFIIPNAEQCNSVLLKISEKKEQLRSPIKNDRNMISRSREPISQQRLIFRWQMQIMTIGILYRIYLKPKEETN